MQKKYNVGLCRFLCFSDDFYVERRVKSCCGGWVVLKNQLGGGENRHKMEKST